MKQITAVIPILIARAVAQSLPPISPGFCAINRSNGYDIVPCDVSTIPGPPHRDVVPPDTKSAEKLAGEAVQQANKPQPAPQFGLKPLFPTTPPATSPQFALDYVPAPTEQAPVDDGEYHRYLQQRNAQNAQFGEQIGAALGTVLRALVVHNKSQSPPSIPSPRQARDSFAAQFNEGTLDVRAQVIGSTLVLHNPTACPQMYSRYAKNTTLLQGLRQIGFSTLTATDDRGYEFTIDLMSPPSVASIAPSGTLVAPTIRDIASTLLSRFSTLPPGTHITLAQGSDSYADLLRREVHAKELAESMPEDWIELNAFYTNADYERRISIATDEEKCHSLETNTALHEKLAQQGLLHLERQHDGA